MDVSEPVVVSHRPLRATVNSNKQSLRTYAEPLHDSVHELEDPLMDDAVALKRIGKREQLKRRFGSITVFALSMVILTSWEAVVAVLAAGLTNGSPVALVWGMLLTISGTLALACSLAEMASMCPIAGAQYQWTYMFAQRKYAPLLTWMQGWITIFAWQATLTGVVYLSAIEIQAVAVLNNPGYVPERWHSTLLMWALMLLMYIVNVRAFGLLPILEMVGVIFHVAFFVCIAVPSVSRLTCAFARDKGLPFSRFFAYVNPHNAIPERSVGLVTGIMFLLSLINIGSSTALNAVVSLSSIALYVSYLIPITLLLTKRIRNESVAWGPFHLNPRLGILVNIYAIIYAVFICVFLPFPPYTPVTATNMNYAGPVFSALIIIALGYWFFRGRKFYQGPICEDVDDSVEVVQVEDLHLDI